MSWSVSASGKLKDVKKAVKTQFASAKTYLTANPYEAKLCEDARKLVSSALRKQSKKAATVSVSAYGHETNQFLNGVHTGEKVQQVSVSVTASFP